MAGSVNCVILVGRVGKDPEIRTLGSGDRVANFSLATSETWKDKSTGEKKEKTEWNRISVFNDGLVGVIERFVKKGSLIHIQGALQTRKWTDSNGVEKYATEVVLRAFNGTLTLLGDAPGSRRDSDDRGGGGSDDYGFETARQDKKGNPAQTQSSFDDEFGGDSIPFVRSGGLR